MSGINIKKPEAFEILINAWLKTGQDLLIFLLLDPPSNIFFQLVGFTSNFARANQMDLFPRIISYLTLVFFGVHIRMRSIGQ